MTEHELQCNIVEYLRKSGIYCFSVPNGFYAGKGNKFGYIKKMKKEGLTAGVSDLIVLLPNAKTVFLELKVKYNKQQPSQKKFEEDVKALGFEYHIVKSIEDVENVLGMK